MPQPKTTDPSKIVKHDPLTSAEMVAAVTALSTAQDQASVDAREKLAAALDPQPSGNALLLPPGWRQRNEEFAGVPLEVVLEANSGVNEEDLIVSETGIVQSGSKLGLPPIPPEGVLSEGSS